MSGRSTGEFIFGSIHINKIMQPKARSWPANNFETDNIKCGATEEEVVQKLRFNQRDRRLPGQKAARFVLASD